MPCLRLTVFVCVFAASSAAAQGSNFEPFGGHTPVGERHSGNSDDTSGFSLIPRTRVGNAGRPAGSVSMPRSTTRKYEAAITSQERIKGAGEWGLLGTLVGALGGLALAEVIRRDDEQNGTQRPQREYAGAVIGFAGGFGILGAIGGFFWPRGMPGTR